MTRRAAPTAAQTVKNRAVVDSAGRSGAERQSESCEAQRGVQGGDLSFVIEGHPVAYVRMIRGVRQKRGERYVAYRDSVGYRAKEAGAVVLSGPVSVRVIAYVDHRRWDVDNLGKAILDALSGICFEDDKQVEDIHVTVLVAGSHEHVRVFVGPVTAEGDSNGMVCSRQKRAEQDDVPGARNPG